MSDPAERVQERIIEILKAASYPYKVEDGRARVERGSTAVFITAHPWQERYTIVELVSPILKEVDSSLKLLERLNELNEKLYFGKAYWRTREVWLAHNLLGDHLDADELIASVGLMAVAADKLDDDLMKAFGGKRWRD